MGRSSVAGASKGLHYTRKIMWQCVIWGILYIALIFILPPNVATMTRYHLSALAYKVATTTLALPELASWLAAFWGYSKLKSYASVIAASRDNTSFHRLALGGAWLAWSLPITATLKLIFGAMTTTSQPGFHSASVIIYTYVALVFACIAFSFIAQSAKDIASFYRIHISLKSSRLIMLIFLLFGILYCFLIFQHLTPLNLTSAHNPYFLPVWLLIISVTIPYLYAWFIGLLSAYQILLTSYRVHGLLYAKALQLLIIGLMIVIVSFIGLQYVTSVVPQNYDVVFNLQLLIGHAVRIINAIGFLTIALGANKLKRIEEV